VVVLQPLQAFFQQEGSADRRTPEISPSPKRIRPFLRIPTLTQNSAAVERKLFWRHKANAQRATRDGDYKYLKIFNTFLFNVVEDPMERAILKVRRGDVYDQIVAEWHEWNATHAAGN
jgi:hypothetical protein